MALQDDWMRCVALDHPFKDAAFFTALERSFCEREFRYANILRNGELVGQFLLTLDRVDIVMLAPTPVRAAVQRLRKYVPGFLKLSIVTVGAMESLGAHWWWNESAVSGADVAAAVEHVASKEFPSAPILIVRDFLASDFASAGLRDELTRRRFVCVPGLPVAGIKTRLKSEPYRSSLPKKMRQNLRKIWAIAEEAGLRITTHTDFQHLIDECYPLFLNVSKRAIDLPRDPIPKRFFEELAALPGCVLTVARQPDGGIVGFILSRASETVSCAYVIGLDYAVVSKLRLYHQLLWAELVRVLDAGFQDIDLGVTSYFVKQGFGATLDESWIAARFQNRMVRWLLNPLVPMLLKVKHPSKRRGRKPE